MAKKGTSLNPGADSTLVAAATKAAMANVPKDLSKTFESVARGYDSMMKTVGASYANAIKSTADAAGSLIKKTQEDKQLGENGDIEVLTGDINGGSVTIADELADIRKDITKIGFFGLALNDEQKKNKAELVAKKDNILNQLRVLNNNENFTNENILSGNFNAEATPKINVITKHALTAFKQKGDKTIQEGEFAGFEVDLHKDDNGQYYFKLKKEGEGYVTGTDANGNPIFDGDDHMKTYPKDIPDLITPSLPDGDVKKFRDTLNKQLTTKTSTYMGDMLIEELSEYVKSGSSLHGFMYKDIGGDSFVKTLNRPSENSATLFFETAKNISGVDENGNISLQANGAAVGFEGLKDSDGDGDIDREDFIGVGNPNQTDESKAIALNNYNLIKDAITNPKNKHYSESTTRGLFLDHIRNTGENMYNKGQQDRQNAGEPANITINGQRYNNEDFKANFSPIIDFLNNPTEGQSMQAPGGQLIEYKNGEWYAAGEKSDLKTIAEGTGLYNYVSIDGNDPIYNTDYYTE